MLPNADGGANMPVKVRIPTPLRKITGGKDEVLAEGATVLDVMEDIERRYPGIKERVFEGDGKLRRFVNIYVNDEDIRFKENLSTKVKDNDELSIIPAIAGGRRK
jgi:molybdopterin synthase sulfur carrier subunit